MAKQEFAIRAAKIVFGLEATEDGKLIGIQEVPVTVYENQFNAPIGSLAAQLLEQARGASEPKTEEEGPKEE